MNLNEFVKKTLLDITNGVVEAQKETLLYIAPGLVANERKTEPQFIKFEVAVTVSTEAGGGIKVWSIADAKAQATSESTNRISFEVPVYFQAPTARNHMHHSRKEHAEGQGEDI